MPNQHKNPRHFKTTTFENSFRGKSQPKQHSNHESSATHSQNDRSTNENLPQASNYNFEGNSQNLHNGVVADENRADQQRGGIICIICCHKTDLLCVGPCDHPVCFECTTRMRVLCLSKECPICRTENELVYVVHFRPEMHNYFTNVIAESQQKQRKLYRNFLTHKYGICFETVEARDSVFDILAHVCRICHEELEFQSFEELARHMRRVHELFHCELCVEFLKLFSWERKFYTRHDLAQHKRIGDADDKSHKGHPLCKFCDKRFLDQDHLYKHLRKDHYFCHFCDVDGKNMFYTGIKQLKEHLKSSHFLCEIGQCRDEELGVSFRHEIDFKAHKVMH
uniref:RING-type E3 ubiquitin transferase n=1 Tax=Romanomermis culicivorax TaxID=13658 RepID=A0A915J1A7_ROMCU